MSSMRLIHLSVVSALFSIVSLAAQPVQAQSVRAPAIVEGDTWEFRTINMWSSKPISQFSKKTIGISGEYARMFYETRTLGKGEEFVKPQVSEGTVRTDLNMTVMFKNDKMEQTWYKWPLEPGKKWEFQYKQEFPSATNSAQIQVSITNTKAEVIGWETVEVPAGKFKALKIVYKNSWTMDNPTSSGTTQNIVWYSPDTKSSVQTTFESFGADGSPQTRTNQQLTRFENAK
ncbi:hypothetical protein ACO0K3_17330 [Undibacterium sp. Rencai35W]